MKSGGPWNLRGLRPEALAAARDAARRSGVSVGEWLNELIEQNDDHGRASLRPTGQPDEDDYARPEPGGRDDYRLHGGALSPRGGYEGFKTRRDADLALEELSEVHARLDRLTDQLEELARSSAPLRGAPMRPPQRRP